MKVFYKDLEGQLWEDKCFGNRMEKFVRKEEAEEELRTTKRALWLARAERANIQWCSLAKIHPLSMYDVIVQWKWVERKCREKAEEYR